MLISGGPPSTGGGGRIRLLVVALATAVTTSLVTACATAPAERTDPGRTPDPGTGQGTGESSPTPEATEPAAQGRAGDPRTLVDGLKVPWGIAYLPDGDALVTERDTARLLRVTPRGQVTEVARISGVSAVGEGGLMGVAVSPDHAEDRFVFLYHTAADDNRIVRYRLGDDGLSDARVILSGIPRAAIHNGGGLAFGPDGYLYASTGEAGDPPLAQDRESLGGKVLRMTMEGRPAEGNPFDGSLVWSYGHRNVQGLAWDPEGRLYVAEFGANRFDEINLVRKGGNYGWPEVEGRGGGGRYIDPIVTWRPAEASPSGMAYAAGSLWVGALRGSRLWQVPLRDGTAGTPEEHFADTYGRLRAVAADPDGSVWVGTSNHDGRGDPRSGDDRILVVPLD
jgi:glucose/arabinose dehydrogenase